MSGCKEDTLCFSFRCRWPVVDESLRSGPMRASASTNARAARSEAERAEREAGQMRSCTPTTSAPSATGRQLQTCRREKRARRQAKIGACTDPPTPVARRRERAGARLSGLFFWTVHGPFSFRARPKRKWGVHPHGKTVHSRAAKWHHAASLRRFAAPLVGAKKK